jgi:hypothetical protein
LLVLAALDFGGRGMRTPDVFVGEGIRG